MKVIIAVFKWNERAARPNWMNGIKNLGASGVENIPHNKHCLLMTMKWFSFFPKLLPCQIRFFRDRWDKKYRCNVDTYFETGLLNMEFQIGSYIASNVLETYPNEDWLKKDFLIWLLNDSLICLLVWRQTITDWTIQSFETFKLREGWWQLDCGVP